MTDDGISRRKIIGENVRRLRQVVGLTQPVLAKNAKTTVSTVSRIERGLLNVSEGKLADVARALGSSVTELERPARVRLDPIAQESSRSPTSPAPVPVTGVDAADRTWWAVAPAELVVGVMDRSDRTSPRSGSPPEPRTMWGLPPLPSMFLGRDDDLSAMKERLGVGAEVEPMGVLASVGSSVAALRGWAGVGKTALASVLAVDTDVSAAYPGGVLWATLGPKPRLPKILAGWGRELGTPNLLGRPSMTEIVETVRRGLRDRQFLLVVDDAWEREHIEVFRRVCPPGCSLLVATRELGALSHLGLPDHAVYRLPTLSVDDGAELLRRLAPTVALSNPEACRRLARALECLPLALHVAGRLLKEEEQAGLQPSRLLEVLESDATPLLAAEAPADRMDLDAQLIPSVGALLKASTDRLSAQDRERFAFLGPIAPRPATVDLATLKAVWACEDPWSTIGVLVARGLLEVIGDATRDNCRFGMHALLVTHARSLLG